MENEKKLFKNIETFMCNRCETEFIGTDLPSECVLGISPIIFNTASQEWDDITITFTDKIGFDISKKVAKLGSLLISFKLKKLDKTGEEKEVLNISGFMKEFNFGRFSQHNSVDIMGLEYNVNNEIEITLKISTVEFEK